MIYTIDDKSKTLMPLVVSTCFDKDLNPEMVKAIIQQESSNDPFAMRYETAYAWLYYPERFFKKNRITLSTEKVCQKTSWGLMQIMGGTARWMGYTGPLSALVVPELNIEYGCKYLAYLKVKYENESDTISAYNAGSPRKDENGKYLNQSYVDSVLKKYD